MVKIFNQLIRNDTFLVIHEFMDYWGTELHDISSLLGEYLQSLSTLRSDIYHSSFNDSDGNIMSTNNIEEYAEEACIPIEELGF